MLEQQREVKVRPQLRPKRVVVAVAAHGPRHEVHSAFMCLVWSVVVVLLLVAGLGGSVTAAAGRAGKGSRRKVIIKKKKENKQASEQTNKHKCCTRKTDKRTKGRREGWRLHVWNLQPHRYFPPDREAGLRTPPTRQVDGSMPAIEEMERVQTSADSPRAHPGQVSTCTLPIGACRLVAR